ncbi:MAG: Holliday junction resolvase RuvX [Firmicutes bacterium]|nr:Holliday junction resolvase RuvX [Bacillota bacterium]
MRCLGLDYGQKRIGLAISDLSNTIATTYDLLINNKSLDEKLMSIIAKEKITHIVIGLPLHMNGDKGDKALLVEAFGAAIEKNFNIEIIYEDERLTTVSAQRILIDGDVRRDKRKGKIDALAATFILQKYLDKQK